MRMKQRKRSMRKFAVLRKLQRRKRRKKGRRQKRKQRRKLKKRQRKKPKRKQTVSSRVLLLLLTATLLPAAIRPPAILPAIRPPAAALRGMMPRRRAAIRILPSDGRVRGTIIFRPRSAADGERCTRESTLPRVRTQM